VYARLVVPVALIAIWRLVSELFGAFVPSDRDMKSVAPSRKTLSGVAEKLSA
jgi:hypothetical protein